MIQAKENPAAGTSRAHIKAQPNNSESPVQRLLPRLDKVRETARDQWKACCPAHDDRNPSLGIAVGDDGRLLLKCWAGCEAAEIVAAVGLTLADLFADDGHEHQRPFRRDVRINSMAALKAIEHEAHLVAVIASDIRRHQTIEDDVYQRLILAAKRIADAVEVSR